LAEVNKSAPFQAT